MRPPLPRLFAAALAVAAGATVPLGTPVLGAALGLWSLAGREAIALAPFVLAGRAARGEAADDATAPPAGLGAGGLRCPRDPVEVRAVVRALEAAVEGADGRARQRVALRIAGGEALEGELLLPDYALA